MKGVSEIIAIIMILMIVVALSALAYTWFSGVFSSLTGGAQTSVETTTGAMGVNFRIETAKNITGLNSTCCLPGPPGCPGCAYNVTVTIRNLGQTPISVSQMAAYINDIPQKIWTNATNGVLPTISYSQIATFNVSGGTTTDPYNQKLRLLTVSGLEQSITIK